MLLLRTYSKYFIIRRALKLHSYSPQTYKLTPSVNPRQVLCHMRLFSDSHEILSESKSNFIGSDVHEYLCSTGISSTVIRNNIDLLSELMCVHVGKWRKVIELLMAAGMSNHLALNCIFAYPAILTSNFTVLQRNLKHSLEIFFGKHALINLAEKSPYVFFMDLNVISRRIEDLIKIFEYKNIKIIVHNNPNILTDDLALILDKIYYIGKEMGIPKHLIVRTHALTHSIHHMKMRHLFLSRAGLYRKPNVARNPMDYKKNASLSDIMDSSDEDFARRVAKLTDEEYEVFCTLMEEEADDDGYDSADERCLSYAKHCK